MNWFKGKLKYIGFLYYKMTTITTDESTRIKYIVDSLESERQSFINLLPEKFRGSFALNSYISGGCIYSLYNNENPKDYDFFLTSQSLANDLREYFIDASGHHGDNYHGGTYELFPLIVTDNAISIGKYQIITRWIGTPEEVVGQFDFHHLMFYYREAKIWALSDSESLQSRELKYNEDRARDIVGTVMRVNKFCQRGMRISQREMSKILLKLNEIGFNERELEILNDVSSDRHFSS